MSNSTRPGYVSLTLEMPIEVADWLASNGRHLEQIARIAANRARLHSEAAKERRKEKNTQRLSELWNLGRVGYRRLRRINGGKNLNADRTLVHEIASELNVNWRELELAVVRFKKDLTPRVQERRRREVKRLHSSGWTNVEIAARYKVTPVTIGKYLRVAISGVAPLAKANNEKENVPGNAQGASLPVPSDAVKQTGRRA